MSYSEYFKMFYEAQKHDCPYRAFTFDVVDSRNNKEYLTTKSKVYFQLLDYIYSLLEKEEKLTCKTILLKDDNNRKRIGCEEFINGNIYNPMWLGDMVTYFVYNGSISTERMMEIFAQGLRDFNINYSFHFSTGTYQTNNYAEGNDKLYKGYMPQILENINKKNNAIIDRHYYGTEHEMGIN